MVDDFRDDDKNWHNIVEDDILIFPRDEAEVRPGGGPPGPRGWQGGGRGAPLPQGGSAVPLPRYVTHCLL